MGDGVSTVIGRTPRRVERGALSEYCHWTNTGRTCHSGLTDARASLRAPSGVLLHTRPSLRNTASASRPPP
eukprot:197273-Prymnesium_polylepis.1